MHTKRLAHSKEPIIIVAISFIVVVAIVHRYDALP